MFYVPAGVGWYNAPTLQLTPHHMWSGHPTFTLLSSDVTTQPRNIWQNMYFKILIIWNYCFESYSWSLRRVGCSSKHDPVWRGVSPSVGGAVATVPVSTAAQLLVSSRQEHISSSTSSVQWHDAEVSISQPHNTYYYQGEIVIVESCWAVFDPHKYSDFGVLFVSVRCQMSVMLDTRQLPVSK